MRTSSASPAHRCRCCARDSIAIAEHAVGLGLLAAASLPGIAAEVVRDQQRPTIGAAVSEEAVEKAVEVVMPKL